MRRTSILFGLALLCGLIALLLASRGSVSAEVDGSPGLVPSLAPCTFTVLNFNLVNGVGVIEARRPFTVADGDTFVQFVGLQPITATSTSSADVLLNNSYAGSVTGGVSGSFSIANLNGINIAGSTTNSEGRGYQLNELVIMGTTGTITSVIVYDYAATTAAPPYYPRGIAGYIHSTSTSGSYAGYRYAGYISGFVSFFGGNINLNASVVGRLYQVQEGSLSEVVTAARTTPTNRSTAFQPTDIIAQFARPDFSVGGTGTITGHVNPGNTFVGAAIGTINGGFVLDHNALVVDAGPNVGKGWLVGEFTFSDTAGNLLTGPWLTDLTGNSVSGYLFQIAGTGIYSDSLLFANVNGSLFNQGRNFTGNMSGVFCEGSHFPTATPQATLTGTPTIAQATSTSSTIATHTPTGQVTGTQTPSLSTATATVVPTVTATPCTITFTDVPVDHTFYPFIRCLACRGIISGYADGTFKPGNEITRGQIAKMVSNAAGFSEDPGLQIYEDVNASNTFYVWINRLSRRGHMGGYACGTVPEEPCVLPQNRPYFRPYSNATRGQLAKIVSNAAGIQTTPSGVFYTDVQEDNPFYVWIMRLTERGVMSGYECGGVGEPCDPQNRPYFRPFNNVTRGQASKIVANTFYPGCETPSR